MYLIGIVEVSGETGGETDETDTTAAYGSRRYGGNDGDVWHVSERAISLSAHWTLKRPRHPPDTRRASLGRICLFG